MGTEETVARGAEDIVRLELTSEAHSPHRGRTLAISALIHLLVLLLLLFPPTFNFLMGEEFVPPGKVIVRFWEPGGKGPGGGGGGGGSGGRHPTAFIRARLPEPKPEPAEETEPRRAPIAPRRVPALRYDHLEVPDLPNDTARLFDHVFSPDETDFPGLSLTDARDFGGLDIEPSSGSGGGLGGGEGTGVGTGTGWGVGPGEGGGFGGGKYRPGGYDVEPILVYQPPEPAYPPEARKRMVTGEVILQILVRPDGSTEVVGVIKSLPYCVNAAKENARLWRWKPALQDGKPVEALGIITVRFDLFASKG